MYLHADPRSRRLSGYEVDPNGGHQGASNLPYSVSPANVLSLAPIANRFQANGRGLGCLGCTDNCGRCSKGLGAIDLSTIENSLPVSLPVIGLLIGGVFLAKKLFRGKKARTAALRKADYKAKAEHFKILAS